MLAVEWKNEALAKTIDIYYRHLLCCWSGYRVIDDFHVILDCISRRYVRTRSEMAFRIGRELLARLEARYFRIFCTLDANDNCSSRYKLFLKQFL